MRKQEPPTDRQLAVFIAVRKYGSQSNAARALGVSRQYISKMMKKLAQW